MATSVTEGGSNFYLRFWGVRGSIACSNPETRRYGGNTSCIEIRCGDRLLVFDGGTGLRPLGLSLPAADPLELDHFYSHTHWDHIVGVPFFCPAYRAGCKIHVRAGHLAGAGGIEAALRQAMTKPLFPVPLDVFHADIDFSDFSAGDTLDLGDGIVVRTAPLNHPDGATGYRVEYDGKSICYVTDTEHVPGHPDQNILGLIKDADLVIYDSTYTDDEIARYAGWGHSTWQEGVRLCQAAGAKRLAIFHHDPARDDDALDQIGVAAAKLFAGAFVAREQETIYL
ncbi:MAG: MBL fold metallo-hydrolase [Proteobacteria bacterium]|nr:MBL fold metallo-hydrolase [Pseudomonadota bacterium]MDA1323441.1 MBL fold metallo-hydrolase [Pseudomonadota bacterium]